MMDFYKEYLKASTLGLEIGLSILTGAGLGYGVEHYINIKPWGLIIGTTFGIATAGRILYRLSKQYLKESSKKS